MNFSKTLEALKAGLKVKLPSWKGYWVKEGDTVKMYCKNGEVLDIRETKDVFYTLCNIASDEWEVVGDCDLDLNVKTFRFGEALRLLKQGKKVARRGWNGKGAYLFLLKGGLSGTEVHKQHAYLNENIEIQDCISMKTAQNTVCVGWLASQTDMFAEDWIIVD